MKIAFANVEFVIDFETLEEAEAYKEKNEGKHWFFESIERNEQMGGWTMTVRRPYKYYLPGW